MIGVDPHKATHTAVAIGRSEEELGGVQVRATRRQVDQLVSWAVFGNIRKFLSGQSELLRLDPPLTAKSALAGGADNTVDDQKGACVVALGSLVLDRGRSWAL